MGNHEETTSGPDGFIDNYAACLPDQLGVTGIYAHQYYFDYPPAAPLARFILIDPALYRGSTKANYCTSGDTANCDWLKARIDDGKDNAYTRGAGPVLAIVANVGRSSYTLSTSDPEAPYFSTWMDPSLNSKGFLRFTVSPDSIDAQFVAGTGSYADHFTIGGATAPTPTPAVPTPTPMSSATPIATPTKAPTPLADTHTYTFTAVADSYVVSNQRNKSFGTAATLRVDTSPTTYSYLRFDVRGLAEPVASARVLVYALSGSSTGYQVGGVADNSWTEANLTFRNAPPVGPVVGSGTVSLALADTNATAISFSSREGANPPLLVVINGPGVAAAAVNAGAAEPGLVPASEPPSDADGDGLPDAGELANGTDPVGPDSDGDGMPDLWEVEAGLDPRFPTGAEGLGGAGGDPDGDEITNLAEYAAQTDPWRPAVDDTPRLYLPLVNPGVVQ